MCGGSPDIDTSYQDFQIDEAKRARAEEDARQARIDEGLAQIAAVFEGGTYAPITGDIEAYQPTETVMKMPHPMAFLLGPQLGMDTSPREVEVKGDWTVKKPEERGEAITYEGMAPLLAQREQAQKDFYLPQLDNRRNDAQEQLTFALARAGLLDSTAAGERQGDLAQQYSLERGSILSKIAQDIAGQSNRLNQQRSSIEAGLRASGDASAAANQALSTAVTFRDDMPTLDPLGNVFYGITQGIGAARQGQEVERIRRLATPNPLNTTNAGRLV